MKVDEEQTSQIERASVAGEAPDLVSGLLPCPFCGNAAFISFDGDTDTPNDWSANCDNTLNCGASIGGLFSEEAARNIWNTRTVPARQAGN